MADMISYTWEVLGYRSLNPDDFRGARTFIETERGPYPGKAVLLFRDDIAAEIMADEGPLTINIRKWIFANDEWAEQELYEFQGFFPVSSRVPDGMDHTVVEVTFKDARKLLSEVMVQRRFNVVTEVINVGTGEYLFDPTTINGLLPWRFNEILQQLFAFSPLAPSFPSSDNSIPINLVFQDESLASAIEKLLATRAKAYVYELSTGIAKTVDLQSPDSKSGISAAIGEKRLKWDFRPEIIQPLETEFLPWSVKQLTAPITQLSWQAHSTIAGEPKKVVIQHFEPNIDDLSLIADAWYKVLESPLDQIFQGVVDQELNSALTHARFWYENGETSSRFQNKLQKEIPWPKPPISLRSDFVGSIQGPIIRFDGEGADSVAVMSVEAASNTELLGAELPIIDLSGCVFDEEQEALVGVWVWASKQVHAGGINWVAFNRCCV